jgi:hypothetical protein
VKYDEVLEQLATSIRKRDGAESLEAFKEWSRPMMRAAIDREMIVQLISREQIKRRLAMLLLFPELIPHYILRIRRPTQKE